MRDHRFGNRNIMMGSSRANAYRSRHEQACGESRCRSASPVDGRALHDWMSIGLERSTRARHGEQRWCWPSRTAEHGQKFASRGSQQPEPDGAPRNPHPTVAPPDCNAKGCPDTAISGLFSSIRSQSLSGLSSCLSFAFVTRRVSGGRLYG